MRRPWLLAQWKPLEMMANLEIQELGLQPYAQVLELQKQSIEALRLDDKAPEKLFLVEHPAVYTLGRKGQRLIEQASIPPLAVEAISVERGGETTYHNPGQLVVYPILKLQGEERSVPAYLRGLEEVLIQVLDHFGIATESREGATGVWLKSQNKKIASIGVAIRRWITFHGLALNVNNDLSGFGAIQPCGFQSNVMTSMEQVLGEKCPQMAEIKRQLIKTFCLHFHRMV